MRDNRTAVSLQRFYFDLCEQRGKCRGRINSKGFIGKSISDNFK